MARCGHAGPAGRCPLLRVEQTYDGSADTSGFDPGRVKTCTRGECAELFSLFSPFDGACQSGSFLIQRNRDKRSTRKFDVGVFTQPAPEADLLGRSAFGSKADIVVAHQSTLLSAARSDAGVRDTTVPASTHAPTS